MSATGTPLIDAALLARLERLRLAARTLQLGTIKGERKSRRKGSSTDFADYRDYVQGDDLRHVDWNLFARLDALHLKVFQDQEDLTLTLLIDSSASMAFGAPTKFDFARRLAAALGYIALTRYDRVVVEAAGTDRARLDPCRGRAGVRRFFSFLEGMQAGGAARLDEACRALAARQARKGVTVLFSDFLEEGGYEDAVRRLAQCGEAYAVQILAPEEIDPQLAGDLKLIDAETGVAAEVSVTGALLEDYRRRKDAYVADLARFCRARGMGHFLLSSATAIEAAVMQTFRRGGMLQ